jgi:predicted nucleic acid-binding protein
VDARFGLCLPSIAELWYMVFNSARVESNSRELEIFLRDYEHWDFNLVAASEFGRIKAELEAGWAPNPRR